MSQVNWQRCGVERPNIRQLKLTALDLDVASSAVVGASSGLAGSSLP